MDTTIHNIWDAKMMRNPAIGNQYERTMVQAYSTVPLIVCLVTFLAARRKSLRRIT